MREHDYLVHPGGKRLDFLARSQSAVIVEARHWIVDDHDLVRQIGVLFQGRKKERKC